MPLTQFWTMASTPGSAQSRESMFHSTEVLTVPLVASQTLESIAP